MKKIVIALDAMGGDNAPDSVIEGAELFLKKNNDVFFNVFGHKDKILKLLDNCPKLKENSKLFHCEEKVSSEDKPRDVVRNSQTSLHQAITSVKNGYSHAVISAGNTGALMALSTLVLRTMQGIHRPAIVTYIPTKKDPCVMLDLGANAENTKDHLLQFALMGTEFSKAVLGVEKPKVGLLNIGSEAMKGNDLVQGASELIASNSYINYQGFAEGTDIFSGNFDVIVTDGFTGNVTLKTIEGTANFIKGLVKYVVLSSIFSKIALGLMYLVSISRIKKSSYIMNTKNYNGAMLIGLKGVCIKSHGNADKIAFKNSIDVAYKIVCGNVNDKLLEQISSLNNN